MYRIKQKTKSRSKNAIRHASEAASKATVQDLSTSLDNAPSTRTSEPTTSAVSNFPASTVFHFLRVPAEIRLIIFRFLLLEPPCASLDPTYSPLSPLDEVQRGPSILQTNRQIYDEASSFLYSELQLVVRPGCTELEHYTSAVKGISAVWRHLPSHSFGRKNANGLTEYSEGDRNGVMEPHVFTRFRRVSYEADFNFFQDGSASCVYIKEDLQISVKDESRVIAYLNDPKARRLPAVQIIQQFVTLLSKSPLIAILEFALSIEFRADPGIDDFIFDLTLPQQELNAEQEQKVNQRAYELFLESGALEPLKNLTNVKCIEFDFGLISPLPRQEVFEPKPKHVHIINNLKAAIERNWMVEQRSH